MLTEDAVQIAPRELLEEATIEKRCKDERMSTLDHIDLSLKLTRAQEAKRLSKAQARLLYLRLVLGRVGRSNVSWRLWIRDMFGSPPSQLPRSMRSATTS